MRLKQFNLISQKNFQRPCKYCTYSTNNKTKMRRHYFMSRHLEDMHYYYKSGSIIHFVRCGFF